MCTGTWSHLCGKWSISEAAVSANRLRESSTSSSQQTKLYMNTTRICHVIWYTIRIYHNALLAEVAGGCTHCSASAWASYQIRKIAGCACAGNAGNVFPRRRFQRKPLVSDPGMHHGTCVTHVPWCMSGSLACSDGENVPGIPGACAPAILCIWQEAHGAGHCTAAC